MGSSCSSASVSVAVLEPGEATEAKEAKAPPEAKKRLMIQELSSNTFFQTIKRNRAEWQQRAIETFQRNIDDNWCVYRITYVRHSETKSLYGHYLIKTGSTGTANDHKFFSLLDDNFLTHPGIIRCFSHSDTAIYMENMDSDLRSYLNSNILTINHRKSILLQIGAALRFLHGIGVVHGNLTSLCIYVKKEKEGCNCKIADGATHRSFNTATEDVAQFGELIDEVFVGLSTMTEPCKRTLGHLVAYTKSKRYVKARLEIVLDMLRAL